MTNNTNDNNNNNNNENSASTPTRRIVRARRPMEVNVDDGKIVETKTSDNTSGGGGNTGGGKKNMDDQDDDDDDTKPFHIPVPPSASAGPSAPSADNVVPYYPLLFGDGDKSGNNENEEDDDSDDDSCSSHSSMPSLDDRDLNSEDDSSVGDDDDDDEEDDDDEMEVSTTSSPCNCPRCRGARDEMGEFFNFLNHQMEMQNDDRGVDDDDDDINASNLCDCPDCRATRGEEEVFDDDDDDMSSHSSMPPLHGDDDDDDDTDNDDDEIKEDNDQKKKAIDCPNKTCSEDDGYGENSDHDEEQSCTICFGPPTRKNPFVNLPCCDPNGTSSMRFCTNCMVKTLQATKTNHLEQEYGPFIASMMSRGRNTSTVPEVGECPRCRKLLSVGPSPRTSSSSSKYTIKSPTYEQHVRFAAKRDADFRDIFFFLSFVHYHEVPVELLQITTRSPKGVTMKHIHQLVQWDIIEEIKSEKLYRIEPSDHQKVLRKIMASKGSTFRPVFRSRSSSDEDDYDDDDDEENDPDGENKWRGRAMSSIGNEYFCATVNAVLGFQVKLSIYLINQCLIHLWKQLNLFPHDVTSYDIGLAISQLIGIMNLILVGLLAVVAVGVAVVVAIGYCLVKWSSWLIWNSQLDDKQERRNNMLQKFGIMSFMAIWKYWLHLRLKDLICAYIIEWLIVGLHKLLSVLDIIKVHGNPNESNNANTPSKLRWGKDFYKSLKWILPSSYLLWCLPAEGRSVVFFVMAMKVVHESGLSLKHFV